MIEARININQQHSKATRYNVVISYKGLVTYKGQSLAIRRRGDVIMRMGSEGGEW